MEKVTIVIDLGNSQTRALIGIGAFNGKQRKSHLITLDNRVSTPFRVIKTKSDDDKYDTENSLMFNVKDQVFAGQTINQLVVSGLMAKNEYEMTYTSPDVSQPKYRNKSTLFNIIQVLYRSLEFLKENCLQDVTYESLVDNCQFSLTLLLPPEQAEQQENLENDLKNLRPVEFLLPSMTLKFNISSVNIQQEGYTAFYGTFIDRRTKEPRVSLMSEIMKRNLIIDVGDGTTDIMLVDQMKALESSKRTINIGGSNVRSFTRLITSKETGKSFEPSAFIDALQTGVLGVGNSSMDITQYINEAKYNVAYKIVSEIKEYLLATQIVPSSINNVLVVGGGTMQADNPVIETLGHYIHEHFKSLTPETDYIDINSIDTNITLYGADELFSARNVNVIGAGILTDLRDLNSK